MDLNKLRWKSKLMTIKMAKVRGFEIDSIDKTIMNYDLSEFNNWLANIKTEKDSIDHKLTKIYYKQTNKQITDVQIFFFASQSDYNNQRVVNEFQSIIKNHIHPEVRIIGTIITDWKLSKNAMENLNKDYPFLVQTFELADFGYDFSTHAFGADYYRLTDIDELYNISPNQLPVMKMDNIIAKFYAWMEGSIIAMQFTNISVESVGNSSIEYFRIVK